MVRIQSVDIRRLGNPKHCDWGDITWGHYTSRDGLHWTHDGQDPVLAPSKPYDQCGVFTGCFHGAGPHGEPGQLTLFYTSAAQLPINWALPYTRNSEGLAMATSGDGGHTWTKSPLNPILAGEPAGLAVTGWRDPFVARWPALDAAFDDSGDGESLYAILSGGILDSGPVLFLYRMRADDLTRWTYCGPLVHFTAGAYTPTRWTGHYGVNWECGNFMTLGDGAEQRQVLLMGSEGGRKTDVPANVPADLLVDSVGASNPYGSWMLWMAGHFEAVQPPDAAGGGGAPPPKLVPEMMGLLDHGILYAASSYEHPVTKQRIVWGWLKEDTLAPSLRTAKGWCGCLSLPRELFLGRIDGVTAALHSPLEDIASVSVAANGRRPEKTLHTLGIRPLPGLEALRRGTAQTWTEVGVAPAGTVQIARCRSPSFELAAQIRVPDPGCCHRVGFHLRHSADADLACRISVYLDVATETLVLERGHTNGGKAGTPQDPLAGPFTLFRLTDGHSAQWETLRLRIFCDGDTVEVFANDRFALSGLAYVEAGHTGVSCFVEAEDDSSAVVFESIELWDEMASCVVA